MIGEICLNCLLLFLVDNRKKISISGQIRFADKPIKSLPSPSQLKIELRDVEANVLGSMEYKLDGWNLNSGYKYFFKPSIQNNVFAKRFFLTATINAGWKRSLDIDPSLKKNDFVVTKSYEIVLRRGKISYMKDMELFCYRK